VRRVWAHGLQGDGWDLATEGGRPGGASLPWGEEDAPAVRPYHGERRTPRSRGRRDFLGAINWKVASMSRPLNGHAAHLSVY